MNVRTRGLLAPVPPRKSRLAQAVAPPDVFVMLGVLQRHRLLLAMLAVSTLVAGVCAKLNTSGDLVVGGAAAHVMIDYPDASIVDRSALPQDLRTLQNRAELYGRLMTTTPVLRAIAERAGVPANQLSGVADITADVPIQFSQAGSEQHASELQASRARYRLEMQADPYEPLLTIYSEAPSVYGAEHLADSAVLGMQDFLRQLAREQGFPEHDLPQLRPLGDARGGVTNSGAEIVIAGLTFVTAFALSLLGLLLLVRRPWRRRDIEHSPAMANSRLNRRAAADWPHTTRLLPWSIAGLIAMIWLTPFDRIQLSMHAPVNITLDRLVLPVVFAIWLIAFTAGPGAAPRIRLTRVHLAMAAYLACAFLSVVLDAGYLNHAGELTLALKKLPLLVSFLSIFVIVASSVRRTEVPAFMTYSLVLAVIVGLEVIYEYHTHQDLFVSLASKVFTGPFEIVNNSTTTSIFDSQGRAWVEGPAAYGVELVTMLSIVMPMGVLGALRSKTRIGRIRYSLAVLVLLYAMLATDRKTALLAPAVVFLTLAYFRRRELLSLAPLGLVVAIALALASPGTLQHVIAQFTAPNATHVATVDSRTANYDAIRPDLWSHLLFGRGYGTYAPPTDRVIDSDILLPLVETGVLGLVTFLLIPLTVIVFTRKAAAGRDPLTSPAALCGVSAAVCFLSVVTLYSAMSLPHAPDVFLYVVGLAVAAVAPGISAPPSRRRERGDRLPAHRAPARRRVHVGRQRAALVNGRTEDLTVAER